MRRFLLSPGLWALVLLSASAWLYVHDLGRVPVYLGLDEAHFAVHGDAIARTGRNLNGDVLPLFISLADPLGDQPTLAWGTTWYHPTVFYLIALTLKVVPLSEAAIRFPTAFLGGVINVGLMYLVAYRLFRERWLALIAAALLATCPANLVIARQAGDYLGPVTFILAWLWCLEASAQTGDRRTAFWGGLILGAGCYSYVTSWLMMPLYLALSMVVYAMRTGQARWVSTVALLGFALPLMLLAPWLWRHPEMFANIRDQYLVANPQASSFVSGVGHGSGWSAIVRKTISTYWDFFNPSFLFVTGAPNRGFSTGQAGVFLWPMAVLLPVGVYRLCRKFSQMPMAGVLLAGLFSAPIAAALKGTTFEIQRASALLPFAVLVSVAGLAALQQSRHGLARAIAVVLILAAPIQFVSVYRDYLGPYRERSAMAADPTRFRETAEFLIAANQAGRVPAVYLTAPMNDVSAKWRFYVSMHGHEELLQRTKYVSGDPLQLTDVEMGSLLVMPIEQSNIAALVATHAWTVDRIVADEFQSPALAVLKRVG